MILQNLIFLLVFSSQNPISIWFNPLLIESTSSNLYATNISCDHYAVGWRFILTQLELFDVVRVASSSPTLNNIVHSFGSTLPNQANSDVRVITSKAWIEGQRNICNFRNESGDTIINEVQGFFFHQLANASVIGSSANILCLFDHIQIKLACYDCFTQEFHYFILPLWNRLLEGF
jgi:hypothetical protein